VRWIVANNEERRVASHTCGAQPGMNTTKLIAHWTMSGDGPDAGGRFQATDDIGAALAHDQPTLEPTATPRSFLIKGANEESWQPLDG